MGKKGKPRPEAVGKGKNKPRPEKVLTVRREGDRETVVAIAKPAAPVNGYELFNKVARLAVFAAVDAHPVAPDWVEAVLEWNDCQPGDDGWEIERAVASSEVREVLTAEELEHLQRLLIEPQPKMEEQRLLVARHFIMLRNRHPKKGVGRVSDKTVCNMVAKAFQCSPGTVRQDVHFAEKEHFNGWWWWLAQRDGGFPHFVHQANSSPAIAAPSRNNFATSSSASGMVGFQEKEKR